tara:strand:+ start:295 stop:456 length:162 start_codon:yes stop_codon:yes gene_type:complete
MKQEELTTTLSEDLRSLLDDFDGGKIDEETLIEVIGKIAQYYVKKPKDFNIDM